MDKRCDDCTCGLVGMGNLWGWLDGGVGLFGDCQFANLGCMCYIVNNLTGDLP